MLKRIFLAITLVASIVITTGNAASAHHARKECPQHWWLGTWQVKQLIKCAAAGAGISVPTSIRVADCESHFDPSLYSTGNAGVFQHAVQYWPDRAEVYGFEGWSVFNARANVFVTVRMVKAGGWNPWSCY
jgi:hypothetical protein